MKKKIHKTRFDRLYDGVIRFFFLSLLVFIASSLFNVGLYPLVTKITRFALYAFYGFGILTLLLFLFSLFFKP